MVRWLYEWSFNSGLTIILETGFARSPPSIGGQFRRVTPRREQFCESLTSLELVPREKFKFPFLRNENDLPSPDLKIYIIREECLYS